MGIQAQASILWCSVDVESNYIYHLIYQEFQKKTRSRQRPKVVIDANAVAFKYLFQGIGPSRAVIVLAKEFSAQGIDVIIIVCDNSSKRHHSKRATILRRGKREREGIQLVENKIELSNLLRSPGNDSQETIQQINVLQKSIRTLEKNTNKVLPSNFIPHMKQLVDDCHCENKGSIDVTEAPFQADPDIARRVVCGEVDCIISDDSDYAMYIGPSASTDMIIRDPYIHMNTLSFRKAKIVTGQESTMSWIDAILKVKETKNYFPKPPKYPIFDKLEDPISRAFFAVAMGCDVLPGGLHNFGPAKAFEIKKQTDNLSTIKEKQEHIRDSILSFSSKTKIDMVSLLVNAQAILYELTFNEGYIFNDNVPNCLDSYLNEFKLKNATTKIVDCVGTIICPGIIGNNDSKHKFMSSCEPKYLCCGCKELFCQYCMYETGSEAMICIKCKKNPFSNNRLPTEDKMREALRCTGVFVPVKSTYIDVVELFESLDEFSLIASSLDTVIFPLEPPSIFYSSADVITDRTETIFMKDISSLIVDDNISATTKSDFISIVASLVDMTQLSQDDKKIGDSWRSVMAKNVLQFANDSRVHEGERLCKRAVRHAMDPASPTMFESTVSIGIYKQKSVIILNNKVKASMRSCLYDVSTCFNSKSFVASSCSCKAGCRIKSLHVLGNERTICTHGMTHLVSLSLCLFNGLAEHLLVELRARLHSDSDLEAKLNRDDIRLLMLATGNKRSSLLLDTEGGSIHHCLEDFSVRTDLSKSCTRFTARASAKEYGLIRNYVYNNPLRSAAKIIDKSNKKGTNDKKKLYEVNISEGSACISVEEYTKVQNCIDGLKFFLRSSHPDLFSKTKSNTPIGLSVVKYRSDVSSDLVTRLEEVNAIRIEWAYAFEIGTGLRYHPKKKFKKDDTSHQSSSVHRSKSKRDSLSQQQNTNVSKQHKRCCISWCRSGETKYKTKKRKDDNGTSIFTVQNLAPKEVKRRTGFHDLFSLLSYVVIICGGDINLITSSSSKMTWLEKWILYFEFLYGHSKNRWCDYESEYKLKEENCRRVFTSKLNIAIDARNRWPMYLSHKEDCRFRKKKWNDLFENQRVIMHDNTNVTLPTPTDADKQRSLRSEYYAECCAKGGVCIQLGGWIRTLHLFTGGIDDSKYIKQSKILMQQQIFQQEDSPTTTPLCFINIFDKGYRVTMIAKQHLQRCLQPTFSQSDTQFSRNDVLHSASVAVVRSGNERAVKNTKHCWIVQRGVRNPNFDLAMLDDIWLAWGFQVNFMYGSVL